MSSSSVTYAAQDPSVVVLFGDSISVGYNLEENFTENFGSGRNLSQMPNSRPLLETDAVLNGASPAHPATVVNWGVGGSTTANGVSRISSALDFTKNQYPSENYFVLIHYGTNDIGSGLASSTTAFNIRQMINKVRAKGSMFTPVASNLLPRSDRAVEPANSQIVPEVLSDGTPLVRLYESFVNHPGGYTQLLGQETSFASGQLIRLHPNAAGYKKIAETWYDEALAELVPKNSLNISGALMLLLDEENTPPPESD